MVSPRKGSERDVEVGPAEGVAAVTLEDPPQAVEQRGVRRVELVVAAVTSIS